VRESRSPGTATEGHFPRSVASGQGMGSGTCLVARRQLPTRVATAREAAMPAKADMLAMSAMEPMLAKAIMLAKVPVIAMPAKVAVAAREVPVPAKVSAGGLMARMGADSLRLTVAD
jgi:hypothetical protein